MERQYQAPEARPAPGPPPGMRGPVGAISVILFWLCLLVSCLPLAFFAIGFVLDLFGASSSTVYAWNYMGAFMLILVMLSGPATILFGIIALATKPAPPQG